MRKRIVCISAAVLILFAILSCVLVEADTGVISCGNATIIGDQTATVDLSIRDNPGFMAMSFSLEYDTDNLEIVSVENLLGEEVTFKSFETNYLLWSKQDITDDCPIVSVTFKAKDGAALGNYDIDVKLVNAADYCENLVDAKIEDGVITVAPAYSATFATAAENDYIIHFTQDIAAGDTFTLDAITKEGRFESTADNKVYVTTGLGEVSGASLAEGLTYVAKNDETVDAYIILSASDIGSNSKVYVSAKLNGEKTEMTDITCEKVSTFAPSILGASIEASADVDKVQYITKVNVADYLSISAIKTFIAATRTLDDSHKYDFDDVNSAGKVGVASMKAHERNGMILDNKLPFRNGDVYSTFRGVNSVDAQTKYSARTVISLADVYGNALEIDVASNNNEPDKAIENGVYNRSINQIKRLIAKSYISENKSPEFISEITEIPDKALWNCDITQVWNYVIKAYAASK